MSDDPVAVIGAGPYGLTAAAFLRHAGVPVRVFGETMESWRRHMPRGMLLRGRRRSSHLPDPERRLSIDDYEATTGVRLAHPIPLEQFIEYAGWYQRQAVPDIDRAAACVRSRMLRGAHPASRCRSMTARRSGPLASSWPRGSRRSPTGHRRSRTCRRARCRTRRTTMTSARSRAGGCSWSVRGTARARSAALLAESQAQVELVARAGHLKWLRPHQPDRLRTKVRMVAMPPTDLGGWRSAWVAAAPDVLHRLPASWQVGVWRRCVSPAGADWLRPRFDGIPVVLGRSATSTAFVDGEVRVDARRRHRATAPTT